MVEDISRNKEEEKWIEQYRWKKNLIGMNCIEEMVKGRRKS